MFTRVFYPATPDDFFADPCAMWDNEDLMVAEGIAHMSYFDNTNVGNGIPGFVWGYTVGGELYDYGGFCGDGMVGLNTVRKWKVKRKAGFPDCWPECLIVQVEKGPRLNCD
jgi:hypothetical protein